MSESIRAKLEALISDSGMFNAGVQHERQRIQAMLAFCLEALRNAPHDKHRLAIIEELWRTLYLIEHENPSV
jgi:hypothetical protein